MKGSVNAWESGGNRSKDRANVLLFTNRKIGIHTNMQTVKLTERQRRTHEQRKPK